MKRERVAGEKRWGDSEEERMAARLNQEEQVSSVHRGRANLQASQANIGVPGTWLDEAVQVR